MTPKQQVRAWFEQYGKVVEVKSDPRGDWARGYLNDITAMILDQIERAEKRGYNRGLKAKPKKEAKK